MRNPNDNSPIYERAGQMPIAKSNYRNVYRERAEKCPRNLKTVDDFVRRVII